MYTFLGYATKINMCCDDTAIISNDWNNRVQEVLDSYPVIILIIIFFVADRLIEGLLQFIPIAIYKYDGTVM